MDVNNKMIAEFMGHELSEVYDNFYKIKTGEYTLTRVPSYHISWDALMPVVDKCTSTNYEVFLEKVDIDHFICNNIESVYTRVIEFIEGYNDYKDDND